MSRFYNICLGSAAKIGCLAEDCIVTIKINNSPASTMVTLLMLLGSVVPAAVGAAAFDIEFEELAPGVWAGIRPDAPRFPVMGTSKS